MMDETKISVGQVRNTLLALLDHMQDSYGDTVELASDYFWSIPDAAKFDVYNKPEELTIGQISEVYGHIVKLATSSEDVATYQLRWFAQLFDAIAHDKPV